MKEALAAMALMALVGCGASGGPIEVELGTTRWAPGKAGAGARLAVAVHDQRQAVVSGGQAANQVGARRGGAPIRTKGGDLSANLVSAIGAGLRAAGYEVQRVVTAHTTSDEQVRAAVAEAPAGLLLVVRAWEGTLGAAIGVGYDVSLHYIEGDHGERAAAEARGQQGFEPRGPEDAAAYAQRAHQETLEHVLESLFAQPALRGALPGAED